MLLVTFIRLVYFVFSYFWTNKSHLKNKIREFVTIGSLKAKH